MIVIKVKDKEYEIEFGYRSLVKGGLIDKLAEFENEKSISKTLALIADLLLAGLIKHNAEFDYRTDDEKAEKLDKVYDLMDSLDAEDEGTDVFELYTAMSEELMKVGFLHKLTEGQKETEKPTAKKAKK